MTLSDKIGSGAVAFSIHVNDVKEFIKKLKEAFDNVEMYKTPLIRKIIDTLAGKELTK